jgi:hypothetical protein
MIEREGAIGLASGSRGLPHNAVLCKVTPSHGDSIDDSDGDSNDDSNKDEYREPDSANAAE